MHRWSHLGPHHLPKSHLRRLRIDFLPLRRPHRHLHLDSRPSRHDHPALGQRLRAAGRGRHCGGYRFPTSHCIAGKSAVQRDPRVQAHPRRHTRSHPRPSAAGWPSIPDHAWRPPRHLRSSQSIFCDRWRHAESRQSVDTRGLHAFHHIGVMTPGAGTLIRAVLGGRVEGLGGRFRGSASSSP